jgi:hypothetical protein
MGTHNHCLLFKERKMWKKFLDYFKLWNFNAFLNNLLSLSIPKIIRKYEALSNAPANFLTCSSWFIIFLVCRNEYHCFIFGLWSTMICSKKTTVFLARTLGNSSRAGLNMHFVTDNKEQVLVQSSSRSTVGQQMVHHIGHETTWNKCSYLARLSEQYANTPSRINKW